jgi:hypothetical protein
MQIPVLKKFDPSTAGENQLVKIRNQKEFGDFATR